MKHLLYSRFLKAISRTKIHKPSDGGELAKVLSTFDLTVLGIGSTLGVGIYVLTGDMARNYAGPSVVISFFIAAVASIFAGLCFAEVGVRIPKAGSAYVYSYVCIGEFMGFLVGWNLILEYIIGSASVVKGLFTYLDALLSRKMSIFFRSHMPINLTSFAKFPDFFSLAVTSIFSIALALGAKESFIINNVLTILNIIVVLFVIISGLWKVRWENWFIPKEQVPHEKFGNGGFIPYGLSGIFRAAPTCFYGFIGFDCIAAAGEEAKSPKRSIPIAVISSLLIIFLAYFGISSVLTLTIPYYEQDNQAPLLYVYDRIGWLVAKYVVSAGALCGLLSALMGSMFPLPRIVYSMACDGLLFSFLGKIHSKFRTPFVGTLAAGFVTGISATFFELGDLFTLMVLATLVTYTIVAVCVIILRYSPPESPKNYSNDFVDSFCTRLFRPKQHSPTRHSFRIVSFTLITFLIGSFSLAIIINQSDSGCLTSSPCSIALIILSGLVIIASLSIIALQPRGPDPLFTIPLMPWIPGFSIIINIYLMVFLDGITWSRYLTWMAIGSIIYFSYGIWNSKARVNQN